MACPYLAAYQDKLATPRAPSQDNVCYAGGTAYWEYGVVDPVIQRQLCFAQRRHRGCPRYNKALERKTPYPDGSVPEATRSRRGDRPWWQFWR